MLGKTANGLYWMFRYLERAENTARLIDTGQRIALTRSGNTDEEWEPVLKSSGTAEMFFAKYDAVTKDRAIDWLLRDKANPSSVLSCHVAARQNGRLVRNAITVEVWEALNACYMRAQEMLARKRSERDLPAVLGALRQSTGLVRGATHGTMLRNEIYNFARLGTFLERADNTARIVDVKYYVLLPSVRAVGSFVDNVQWETILRSVSARGGFRLEYGSGAGPREIAQFLILDRRMPRSLAFCTFKICENLSYLGGESSDLPPSTVLASEIYKDHLTQDIEGIFDIGLHQFLETILAEYGRLGQQIEIDYRFYE